MYYIYFSQLVGTYYISRRELDEEELYDEDCGSSDYLVCVVNDLDDLNDELNRIGFIDHAYGISNKDLAFLIRNCCKPMNEED